MRNAWKFESEKNKLAYDMEIEAMYLIGNFSVVTDGKWTELEHEVVNYDGGFVIDKPKKSITLKNIEQQGFPFFCGEMTLEGEIEVRGKNPVLIFETKGINAICVEVGSIQRTILTGDRMSLEGFTEGKHMIKLTIKNNLRNLLGPHHLRIGESIHVTPGDFYKEKCVWHPTGDAEDWNIGYCFAEMSI